MSYLSQQMIDFTHVGGGEGGEGEGINKEGKQKEGKMSSVFTTIYRIMSGITW